MLPLLIFLDFFNLSLMSALILFFQLTCVSHLFCFTFSFNNGTPSLIYQSVVKKKTALKHYLICLYVPITEGL